MKSGGINVNQRAAQIIRFGGFLLPIVLLFYGILIQLGAVDSSRYAGDLALYGIAVAWVALGVYQFMSPSKTDAILAIRLILYHILAVLYILFISGFSMPFIATWTVLLLASYAYFQADGLRLSIFALLSTAAADILLHLDKQEYVMLNILNLLATLIVGMIAVTTSQAGEVDKAELSRSRAEGELQRDSILTLVNNLADGVLSTDREGVIKLFNAAALGLLDTNENLIGKRIDDVIHLVDSRNKRFKFSTNFKTARSVETRDDLSSTISDEPIRFSVIYSPIRGTNSTADGKIGDDGYIIIMRDITKQKSLEEERDEFISVVSHELRTPLTIAEGTLGNVQIMMKRDDIPQATLEKNLATAHDQVLFLARMVNDLSTLSRAERGVADAPEEIDVSSLIHDLYNEYAPQAEAKGLRFNLDLAPRLGTVTASRLYLKELLQNFATNAIKYTKEGEVVVSVKPTKDGKLAFAIKDTGIGISKADQARIYEKFYRSEDYRTRETGGTGLGLYVAHKLARKLGTTITLTSRLNHGSTFGFDLPTSTKDK